MDEGNVYQQKDWTFSPAGAVPLYCSIFCIHFTSWYVANYLLWRNHGSAYSSACFDWCDPVEGD